MQSILHPIDFWILNTTADDWESLEQILLGIAEFSNNADPMQIAQRIVVLTSEGLLQESTGKTFTAGILVESPIDYWFGMTATGRKLWESESPKHA
jgi:hypothetical protein